MEIQLKIMLELQDAMNTRVHPYWRAQRFEWYRAIWIECAELMDHYGWKWWKHQSPDIEQVKLELIDIWHFGLSLLLQRRTSVTSIIMELKEAQSTKKSNDFKEIVESFTEYTLAERNFSISLFMAMLDAVDMTFDDLYRGYIGKNVLNFFRQDNGYKDGSYQKIWCNKEDNEHLVEIMQSLDPGDLQFKDNLYAELNSRYQECRCSA